MSYLAKRAATNGGPAQREEAGIRPQGYFNAHGQINVALSRPLNLYISLVKAMTEVSQAQTLFHFRPRWFATWA